MPRYGSFRADFDRIVGSERPVALARFHDGEYHVLEGLPYNARSGWHLRKPSWLRERLDSALRADLEGMWVGISPPCDWPVGTSYYRKRVKAAKVTFATLFWHSNYARFKKALDHELAGAALVTCGKGDYKVPANGVAKEWDLDALVDELLEEERTILVAAGPCACVIVHEYWKRQDPDKRVSILDVGASLDPKVLGKRTRHYQEASQDGRALRGHTCDWKTTVPWSSAAAPKKAEKVRGWRAKKAGKRKYPQPKGKPKS